MKGASVDLAGACLLAGYLLGCPAAACGQGADALVRDTGAAGRAAPATLPSSWQAVGDPQLAATRAGFSTGDGLLASFGIERVVYIDGNPVTRFSVDIPDVSRMTAVQAGALAAVARMGGAIQDGPGNGIDPAALGQASAALVIQNSLDNRDIRSLTTINASTNGLGQFGNSRLAQSLQSALVGSLGH